MFLESVETKNHLPVNESTLNNILSGILNPSVLTEDAKSEVISIQNILENGETIQLNFQAGELFESVLEKMLILDKVRRGHSLNEGVASALVAGIGTDLVGAGSQFKGMVESKSEKIKHINTLLDELVEWLSEVKKENKDLKLTGSWVDKIKSSHYFDAHWRFFFILDTETYNKTAADIKAEKFTDLEALFNVDVSRRIEAIKILESAPTADKMIEIVKQYKTRFNNIVKLFEERKLATKWFPYATLLAGVTDLTGSIKFMVRLNK